MAKRIIKKYPNRRLYDTEKGIYITLEEVKELVFERVDFQVIDAKTKKDITQNTLLQIIMEQEMNATPLFNTAVLQDFIRFYQEKSQPFFSQYLEQMLNLFGQQKKFFVKEWDNYQKIVTNPMEFFKEKSAKNTAAKRAKKNVSKK